MTKRLVTAIVLLLISLSLSLYSLNFVHKEVTFTVSLIEDGTDVFSASKELLSRWEQSKLRFALLLKHTDVDRIERYYLELSDAVNDENEEKISELLTSLRAYLIVTADAEKPECENIF